MATCLSAPPRFRVLRPLSRGAISKVSAAHDDELNRIVALKELRSRFADDPQARLRFLFEAEITAGLEHPGVVPVYGRGRFDDGRVFFTMRLIQGDDLWTAVGKMRALADPVERIARLRKALDRFVDVCYTIAHAHRRGVIHRDLTPKNIMFGPFGESVVIDWGLAKLLGRPDADDWAARSEEQPWWPATADGLESTRVGKVIGTPRFLSPEQAASRIDLHGPASDVYTLGATLYALLTGQAPFEGPDSEIFRRVRIGAFPKPSAIDRAVAPSLEAVCLRAMALEPEHRFASPLDLGDSLTQWLADEPG